MKLVVALSAIVLAAHCSTVQFAAVPRTVGLPDAASASIRSSQISDLNANILGLSAKPVSTFSVATDLFAAPRALAVVVVDGVNELPLSGARYNVETDGFDQAALDNTVAQIFGADRETILVNKEGLTGSELAQKASEATIDDSVIKTKNAVLRSELEQVYKLIAALNGQTAKLSKSASPDIYRVTISGVSGVNADEVNSATKDVQNALEQLTAALVKVYGDQAVVEVVCESAAIQDNNNTSVHNVVKRAADNDNNEGGTKKALRELYNVTVFTSPDYPAIFAIFAGLAIILALAVLYIAVGIWNMDPGRDSIIYRMTTTRMKKD